MASPSASTSTASITFADLLRHHRAAANLTQEELAERAGLSVDAISTLERGTRRRPRKDTVTLLADALALPAEERAAFAAAARRAPAAALAATPFGVATAELDGRVPAPAASAPGSDASLPYGVVTFLFADIEDSPRLLHLLGDRYASVLAEVQALLRTGWAAHAGHELGTQGDRFFAVFAYPDDALAAAAAAQQALSAHNWPDGAPVRVCMGIHTGAAPLTAGRYVGLEVLRAARIVAAGHGGQVVVSGALADQVAKFGYDLPEGTRLRSLGKHRLQDVPHREELYQLVVPGLPATFPSLRTQDVWPGLRANLLVVAAATLALLAAVGLLLPLAVPAFPSTIGQVAGVAVLVLVLSVVAHPLRRWEAQQWRAARKGTAAIVSVLLSVVVVVTTLFVTKPTLFMRPQHPGYDFSYTYHRPEHVGGSVVVGMWRPNPTLAPPTLSTLLPLEQYEGLWNGCVTQLPDLTLGLKGWKADQCVEVPTIYNGGETTDGRTTTFRIDPQVVWSDGQPITADDFLFTFRLIEDPNIGGLTFGQEPPFNLMTLSKLDARTLRIDWSRPYGDYLTALAHLTPLPLHVYATGKFAGVYDAATGAYNTTLAQQLAHSDTFNKTIPVDNGPFTVQSFTLDGRAVLVKNPRFFSNFFHHPAALDKVTFVSLRQLSKDPPQAALIAMYRQGGLMLAEGLEPTNLSQFGGIPKNEVVSSPLNAEAEVEFNQREVAPNARSNGGVSIFGDIKVRKAFVEAFDRCAAVRAVLTIDDCADPNFHTDEITAPPSPDYDPAVTLPAYNPTDAAALLNQAGYRVVDGIRRFKDGKTPMQLILATAFGGRLSYGITLRMQQDYTRNLNILVSILAPSPPSKLFDYFDQGGVGATGTFDLWAIINFLSPDPVGNLVGTCCERADIPSAQNPDGGNYVGVIDPYVAVRDQLGSQVLDADQRAAVYRDLQRYIAQQLYYEPVYIDADVTLAKPTLCNFKKWPAPGLNTWNMADWYIARGATCP